MIPLYVSFAASELCRLTEVQQFLIAVFEALDDGHIDRNVQCTTDMKNNFKIKKKREL
jgi:hypothetical protein